MIATLADIWHRWRSSQKQRIYIVPTKAGYAYAGLLLIMLLGAINYSNSLGHLLTFLLAGLGQVAMHYSHRNLRLLTLSVTSLEPVFCGQPARFQMTIKNDDDQDRYQIEIAFKKHPKLARWQFMKAYEPLQTITHIEADNQLSCFLPLPTQRRGWYSLPTLKLSTRYPLGLFYSWTNYSLNAQGLVYPRPAGKLPLPVPDSGEQNSQSRSQHGDEEFAGLRNYREGEPLHRVAWKALARDEVMRSKHFSSPQGADLMLRWESLAELQGTEAKLSQLCQWVLIAEQAGHRYGLALPNDHLAPGHGQAHQHQCLKMLALYHD